MPYKHAADSAAQKARVRARNHAFVDEINARTFCAHCSAQPIEWHNPEHVLQGKNHRRIARLTSRSTSLQAIRDEMDRCTPLCRRCHMAEDGRLDAFLAVARSNTVAAVKPPKPCSECQRLFKPLRRGLCSRCYDRWSYHIPTATGEYSGAVKRIPAHRAYRARKREGRAA